MRSPLFICDVFFSLCLSSQHLRFVTALLSFILKPRQPANKIYKKNLQDPQRLMQLSVGLALQSTF